MMEENDAASLVNTAHSTVAAEQATNPTNRAVALSSQSSAPRAMATSRAGFSAHDSPGFHR
jgi:hypothetical protein